MGKYSKIKNKPVFDLELGELVEVIKLEDQRERVIPTYQWEQVVMVREENGKAAIYTHTETRMVVDTHSKIRFLEPNTVI